MSLLRIYRASIRMADLTLGKKDKAVVAAFTDKQAAQGLKLSTDGTRLDGNWMGGRDIAHWKGDKIQFNDLGSKAAEVVQRAVRKVAPKNWISASVRTAGHRPLSEIAREIRQDWKKVNYAAKPYLDAMSQLNQVTDMYGSDPANMIVAYFLGNARSWRGPVAKKLKAELNKLLK